eukprot:6246845-Heterocapsa_arctica.AAC.1
MDVPCSPTWCRKAVIERTVPITGPSTPSRFPSEMTLQRMVSGLPSPRKEIGVRATMAAGPPAPAT